MRFITSCKFCVFVVNFVVSLKFLKKLKIYVLSINDFFSWLIIFYENACNVMLRILNF